VSQASRPRDGTKLMIHIVAKRSRGAGTADKSCVANAMARGDLARV
jgi:hypothetical protein